MPHPKNDLGWSVIQVKVFPGKNRPMLYEVLCGHATRLIAKECRDMLAAKGYVNVRIHKNA